MDSMANKQATVDFWQYSESAKTDLYNKVAKNMGLSPKAAEKDWWVCHVIKALFSLRCADALTFKGGTSLSKAWDISERFSEDVDISFDKSFFGLSGDTRSARDRIRKLTRKYISEEMAPELYATLYVFEAGECHMLYKPREDSDADPTVLLIPYHSILPDDPYIKAEVKVEFSCRNLREPREEREVKPFAALLSPVIDFPETIVPTVVPTRTFLEKVFLLHEEFQKNHPRNRRMSRHLYDLYRLDRAGIPEKAMADTALYGNIVEHRRTWNAIRGIDYGAHRPENLKIVPPEEVLPLWEEDYGNIRRQFIYGEAPSWKELLKAMEGLQERLHAMQL